MLLATEIQDALPARPFNPVLPSSEPHVYGAFWHDRKVPLARRSIRGFHPGRGCGGIQFESLLECSVIEAFLLLPELKSILAQPLTLRYTIDGKEYRYTPDLQIEFWEVPQRLDRYGYQRLNYIECKYADALHDQAEPLGRALAAFRSLTSAPLLIVTDRTLATTPWGDTHDG